jgi:DNA-binding NtrC family response regulator
MNELNLNRKGPEPGTEPQAESGLTQTAALASAVSPQPRQLALRLLRAEAEIHAISRALEQTGWNRRRAADLLSISYRGLLYKIRQYDITTTTASQLAGVESVKVK